MLENRLIQKGHGDYGSRHALAASYTGAGRPLRRQKGGVFPLPELWTSILEAFLLVAALSTDAFFASFAYGTGHIRIPFLSVAVIDGICTALLAVSLFLGTLLRPWLPPALTAGVSFAILSLLGVVKLFDSVLKALIRRHQPLNKEWRFSLFSLQFILNIYADPPEADRDASKTLSSAEAASLAVAMSLDGLAVGFGAGMGNASPVLVLLFSLLLTAAAVMGGSALGNRVAARLRHDLSWVGGALLLLLAAIKLL